MKDKTIKILFYVIILLIALDFSTTLYAIYHFGMDIEANPIIIWFMNTFGVYAGMWLSFLIGLFLLTFSMIVMIKRNKEHKRLIENFVITMFILALISRGYILINFFRLSLIS